MFSTIYFYCVLAPALLPVVLTLFYVYSKDKEEREPISLLIKTFVFGAVFSLPCIPIKIFILPRISALFSENPFLCALAQNVIGIALVEEFFKFLVIMLCVWNNFDFDYRYDGIVYAATSSLGFAALENIIYIGSFGIEVSIGRAIFAIPGHATFGILMGFFLARAKDWKFRKRESNSRINLLLALIVPMAIHGLYDFLLSEPIQSAGLNYIFLIYVILLDALAFFTIRHDFKTDRPLGFEYKKER